MVLFLAQIEPIFLKCAIPVKMKDATKWNSTEEAADRKDHCNCGRARAAYGITI